MKKLFLILFALISINCVGQDTTIYQKRNQIYMLIRQPIANDNPILTDCIKQKAKKRRNQNRAFIFTTSAIFASLTLWYFGNTIR
jgi:hypothetical protein